MPQLERIGNQHDCAPSREYIGVLTSARISEGMAAGIGIGAIYSSALPKISNKHTLFPSHGSKCLTMVHVCNCNKDLG